MDGHTLAVDAGQIDELRRWGNKLAQDDSHPELQPAGRAILLLIDEVERLRAAETVTNGPPDAPPPAGDGGDSAADAQPRRPAPRTKRSWFHGYRRFVIVGVVLGALIFATFALGARLSAPSLDASGPTADADRAGSAPVAEVLGRRRSDRARPRPLEARRPGRHRQGVHDRRALRPRRQPPARGATPGAGDRRRRVPRLPDDQDVERPGRHHRPEDRVRHAGRRHPVGTADRAGRHARAGRHPDRRTAAPRSSRTGASSSRGRPARRAPSR